MSVFLVLLIPPLVALLALAIGKGAISLKELLVQETIVFLLVGISYAIALHCRTSDVETWNGVVAGKQKSSEHCCHPYCCQTCQSCSTDSKGNTTCHSYCCQTCYWHSYDVRWDAWSSNSENIYANGCNSPSTGEPERYTAIRIGEPTAVEHEFTNYIKGNPDSLLRREGAMNNFGLKIPPYPQVYDLYRSQRFLTVGVKVPDPVGLNERLSEINAKWGAPKKVNIITVVVREADEKYLEALREAWLGGKINDIVVVVGLYDDSSTIAWAGVISWTKSEQVKVDLRNAIMALGQFDPQKFLQVVEQEVSSKYEHRRISDFEYLKASIEPSSTAKTVIWVLSLVLTIFLSAYFWINDPFEDGFRNPYETRRRKRPY